MSIIDQFSLSQFTEPNTSVLSKVENDAQSTGNETTSSSLESGTAVGAYFADILASLQGSASKFMGNDNASVITQIASTTKQDSSSGESALATAVTSGAAAANLFSSLLSDSEETAGSLVSSDSLDASSTAIASGSSLISAALSADESIAKIQQQLMASLNANLFGAMLGDGTNADGTGASTSGLLAGIGTSFLDDSLSDESLAAMQSNLLTSLHASLFSGLTDSATTSQTTTDETNLLTASKSAVSDAQANYSFLQNMSELSFGEDGFGLNEFFDTVNIAQHVPIVSSLYQDMTGEAMSAAASLAGGFLYGGPTGLALSAADLVVKGVTGTTVSDAIVDFDYAGTFFGDNIEASAAQEALKTKEEPIEESANAYQFVSRLF
ncbi:hypothetical protein GMES_1575 [Paraglaciecola mesophila KMM 241]|mgnify:FL=1|uniref:Uncharacterized protein n=1 Tax=Paraglaciecola mesophila KMM 241 TaxID=1128912 RepID=K6YIR8_9ALTE|nr:hypothetical protein [Paraglaciecola mesophila]GAC23871.1 hypothetical protein GMES_1575 [Paraglaciecola mesophila KMM 241]